MQAQNKSDKQWGGIAEYLSFSYLLFQKLFHVVASFVFS